MPPRKEIDRNRIRQLLRAGVSPQAIAKRLGISQGPVYEERSKVQK